MNKWILIGFTCDTKHFAVMKCGSPQAATRLGRERIRHGGWLSFQVAKVTAEYVRGSVRL